MPRNLKEVEDTWIPVMGPASNVHTVFADRSKIGVALQTGVALTNKQPTTARAKYSDLRMLSNMKKDDE
jgi:hypothetical protein